MLFPSCSLVPDSYSLVSDSCSLVSFCCPVISVSCFSTDLRETSRAVSLYVTSVTGGGSGSTQMALVSGGKG